MADLKLGPRPFTGGLEAQWHRTALSYPTGMKVRRSARRSSYINTKFCAQRDHCENSYCKFLNITRESKAFKRTCLRARIAHSPCEPFFCLLPVLHFNKNTNENPRYFNTVFLKRYRYTDLRVLQDHEHTELSPAEGSSLPAFADEQE